jgi:hypothetical protein
VRVGPFTDGERDEYDVQHAAAPGDVAIVIVDSDEEPGAAASAPRPDAEEPAAGADESDAKRPREVTPDPVHPDDAAAEARTKVGLVKEWLFQVQLLAKEKGKAKIRIDAAQAKVDAVAALLASLNYYMPLSDDDLI